MADQYLNDPVRVNVGSLDLQACHSVTQLIEFIESENKQDRVCLSANNIKILVYINIEFSFLSSTFIFLTAQ